MGGILRKIARARFGNIPILSDSLRIGKINVTKFHKIPFGCHNFVTNSKALVK